MSRSAAIVSRYVFDPQRLNIALAGETVVLTLVILLFCELGPKALAARYPERISLRVVLPIERDGARILHIEDREVFSAYLPTPRGPVFMTLIQKAFGEEVTTRTWDTVKKIIATYD